MKQIWKDIGFAVLLGVVMPWLILGIGAASIRSAARQPAEHTEPSSAIQTRSVNVLQNGRVRGIELSEYLAGVLLCELPGDFTMEAKKAQAVVARTYTLRTVEKKDKHPGNAICTDPACCQGYTAPEQYRAEGGSAEAVEQARQAVALTEGLVLMYGGEMIDATYFSCSGGHTEDAVAVWGADVPYLQAVSSPGEEAAAHYTDSVTFTSAQFQQALGVRLSGKPATWMGTVTRTEGGGVDTMVIGGTVYQGTTLRSLLGLRSTAFTMTAAGDNITVTTKGFGHRVGMSQYGAQAMSLAGNSYEQILTHYYTGTELTCITLTAD